MNGQLRPTIAQRRRLAAARAHRPPTTPPRLSRRQITVIAIIWLAFFAAALWLAAHDPDYLSRVVEHALGGAA